MNYAASLSNEMTYSKSNLIGASLFADGVACALICGDEAKVENRKTVPIFFKQLQNGCLIRKM